MKKLGVLAGLLAVVLLAQPATALEINDGSTRYGAAKEINFGDGVAVTESGGVHTVSAAAAAITSGTITGVTIENSAIGGSTPAAGAFTTLSATGNTTLGNAVGDTVTITGTTAGTMAKAADSGTTNQALDLNVTTPVDTTGTNTHQAINVDLTIGNATGGTNTATAINIANVSGDAQVTEKGVVIGTGFDTGLEVNSPTSFTSDAFGDGGDQFYGFLQDQVASTTTSVTAAQAGKTFVSNSADVMTLPEASTVLGARYTFVCGTADDFDINPADGTDQIGTVASITGTNTTTVLAPAAGDAIRCTDIGSSITLEAVGADLWVSVGNANGIWTDVN